MTDSIVVVSGRIINVVNRLRRANRPSGGGGWVPGGLGLRLAACRTEQTNERRYGPGVDQTKEELLDAVEAAASERRAADRRYAQALLTAREAGISNQAIGGRAGMTEAAIRMYIRRRKQGKNFR